MSARVLSPHIRVRRAGTRTLVAALTLALSGGVGALAVQATPTQTAPVPAVAAASITSATTASVGRSAGVLAADPSAPGSHSYRTWSVSDFSTPVEFGAAEFFAPTDTGNDRRAAVVVMPGFSGNRNTYRYVATQLASHGFVVMLMDSFSTADLETVRSNALRVGMDYLIWSSPVRTRVDSARIGTFGFSYGGKAALNMASTGRAAASVAVFPLKEPMYSYRNTSSPVLIFGGQRDTLAPPRSHALPAYERATSARAREYIELAGATHLSTRYANSYVATLTTAWFGRFLDGDTSYDQYLCPPPSDAGISATRSSCPF